MIIAFTRVGWLEKTLDFMFKSYAAKILLKTPWIFWSLKEDFEMGGLTVFLTWRTKLNWLLSLWKLKRHLLVWWLNSLCFQFQSPEYKGWAALSQDLLVPCVTVALSNRTEDKEVVSACPVLCLPSALAPGEGNSLGGAETSAGAHRLGRCGRDIRELGSLAAL